jgi:hypothetical protein
MTLLRLCKNRDYAITQRRGKTALGRVNDGRVNAACRQRGDGTVLPALPPRTGS